VIDWQGLRATSGVSVLLSAGRQLGMSEAQCLQGTGLNPQQLDEPLARIASWQEMALIRNLLAFRGDDQELGLTIAQGYSIANMGALGQALATSETLADALILTERYRWFGLSFSEYRLTETADHWVIEVMDDEVPKDCQRFCQDRGLMGTLNLFSQLLQRQPRVLAVTMKAPAPADPERYQQLFGAPIHFCSDRNTIVYPRSMGDEKLPLANPQVRESCQRYCDQMLELQQKPRTCRGQVEAILEAWAPSFPLAARLLEPTLKSAAKGVTALAVAAELQISERQLRRRLQQEQCNFRELWLQRKMRLAQQALMDGKSVAAVAGGLGYSESASFSRVFLGSVGVSPKQFQLKRLRGEDSC